MSSESEETSSEVPVKPAKPSSDDSETESERTVAKRKLPSDAETSSKKKKLENGEAQANAGKKHIKDRKGKLVKASEVVDTPKKKGKGSEEVSNEGTSKKKKKKKSSETQPAEEPKETLKEKPVEEPKPSAAGGSKKYSWLPKDETALAKRMLEDFKANPALNFDEKPKGDECWSQLQEALKEKLSREFTADQIFDKHKRMKLKFKKYEQEQGKKRRPAVDELHGIFKQLWSSEDVSKPGTSAFGSKFAVHSDGEESNGEFHGFPAVASVKKEANGKGILGPETNSPAGAANGTGGEVSRVMKNFALQTSSLAGADPVISFGASLCAGVESLMRSYKLGFEASTANRDLRKRLLEEQAAEYSAMKKRLKFVLDYCTMEEEELKKKLEAL